MSPREREWFGFIARIVALLFIIVFLALVSGGCGDVTMVSDLGSSVDATPSRADGGDRSTDQGPTNPDTHPSDDAGALRPADAQSEPSQQPKDVGGAVLPSCPPEIQRYDCPQPKCDCGDR